jgi:tRNA nucleotidyltransferase (CCA-adding enzyme)
MSNFSLTSCVISLTEKEEQIFNIITDCIKWKNRITTARVAGGWVRDKLLGRFSDDIDIALDDQNGEEFAESINEYLLIKGYPVLSIAVIQANPDQSKHLQTATFRIFDQSIDCVNLRAESYANESRIPEIKCGSALEDALRRDFTINSLFYNLNTKEVEDLTNRGISDLHAGIICTPVDPLVTFKDDPLRLLRAIRFASRFQFELQDDIIQVSKEEIIKQALLTKVSRSRVLKECEGMIGKHRNDNCRPALAIALMVRLSVFDLIFLLPPIESICISGDQIIGN